ncbi:hypothetical protein TOPH_02626 [Tolypocladium ophioglossoides CBS 100239]|uniref:Uncharacterized protein n=1 Tax=Tolypocladium ophioglossoides (strain CBS 100239) TaxID=1163406 RepID=A0A0L0NF56_TOLOC|nr:hypothetical protein TOPH_02626 [Tolypocladium ophioglossoides CBS 100239]
MENNHFGHMLFNDKDFELIADVEYDHAATNMNVGHAAADMPMLFWDDQVAAANTPVLFTDENFQQLLAVDNLVDIAMSALENDDFLPALPNLQPTPSLPLTDEGFERHFHMEGAGGVSLPSTEYVGVVPAFLPVPATPAATSTRLEASKKSLGVKSQVPKAVNSNLAANNMDSGVPRRKISGSEAERRRVSADNQGASKKPTNTAADASSTTRRSRRRGKVAIFTLTGQTVVRVFDGQAATSYHCSDGVIRILADEALEEAKARTAAKEAGGAVEQRPAASLKKKINAVPASVENGSAKRPKAAHSVDAGG